MFDIGFTEMVMVAVVALIVLGPERLPVVAKQAGQWLGKLRRYVDDVKSDINRQMELDELRKLKNEVTQAAQTLQASMHTAVAQTEAELGSIKGVFSGTPSTGADEPKTDWDRIYAVRRSRDRIKERRIEREKILGIKRPRRPLHR
jgi:sec-independent protein translocase protein TatB